MINGSAKGSIDHVTLNKSRDVNNMKNKGENFTLGISIWNVHGLKKMKKLIHLRIKMIQL